LWQSIIIWLEPLHDDNPKNNPPIVAESQPNNCTITDNPARQYNTSYSIGPWCGILFIIYSLHGHGGGSIDGYYYYTDDTTLLPQLHFLLLLSCYCHCCCHSTELTTRSKQDGERADLESNAATLEQSDWHNNHIHTSCCSPIVRLRILFPKEEPAWWRVRYGTGRTNTYIRTIALCREADRHKHSPQTPQQDQRRMSPWVDPRTADGSGGKESSLPSLPSCTKQSAQRSTQICFWLLLLLLLWLFVNSDHHPELRRGLLVTVSLSSCQGLVALPLVSRPVVSSVALFCFVLFRFVSFRFVSFCQYHHLPVLCCDCCWFGVPQRNGAVSVTLDTVENREQRQKLLPTVCDGLEQRDCWCSITAMAGDG